MRSTSNRPRASLLLATAVLVLGLSGCASMGPPVIVSNPFHIGGDGESLWNTPQWVQTQANVTDTAQGRMTQYVMEHYTLFGTQREYVYVQNGRIVAVQY